METEREDWDALLSHPGWLRLVGYAKSHWGGSAYRVKVDQAIAKAEADKTDVAGAVKTVNAISDEVNRLLSYPRERVKALATPKPEETSMQRGGV